MYCEKHEDAMLVFARHTRYLCGISVSLSSVPLSNAGIVETLRIYRQTLTPFGMATILVIEPKLGYKSYICISCHHMQVLAGAYCC